MWHSLTKFGDENVLNWLCDKYVVGSLVVRIVQ